MLDSSGGHRCMILAAEYNQNLGFKKSIMNCSVTYTVIQTGPSSSMFSSSKKASACGMKTAGRQAIHASAVGWMCGSGWAAVAAADTKLLFALWTDTAIG